jgi:hypothetical protein
LYYLRSKAAVDPIKFTLSDKHQRVQAQQTVEKPVFSAIPAPIAEQEVSDINESQPAFVEGMVCTMEEGCVMCGS